MATLRALITGASGFVGTHLAELLQRAGLEVHGVDLRAPVRPVEGLVFRELDLRNAEQLATLMAEARPHYIFHLAAQAAVHQSWSDPTDTYVVNILGQLNVLQAVLAAGIDPAILIVGSNEEYGLILPDETPVGENNPLRPANPYAVSKIAQDMMGYQYFCSHRLRCVRVRPFNHTGPGQAPHFVVPSFARQVAEIEAGLRAPVVEVGNLDVRRDFTDVRDMVRAYYLALQQGEPGEVYNVGSGRAVAIQEVLSYLVSLSRVPVEIKKDPARFRPADVPLTLCDYSRLQARTGWEPQIPLEQTLQDVLDYWRARVQATVGATRP